MGSKTIKAKGLQPLFQSTFAGIIMNLLHKRAYKKIIVKIISGNGPAPRCVLDIGCGGGAALGIYTKTPGIEFVCGIDISAEMAALASRVNRKSIDRGTVRIVRADVADLPLPDNTFGLVCAFDTINFWPDHNRAIAEINRVLEPGGRFVVANICPKPGSRWYEFAKFKNGNDYRCMLESAGFCSVYVIFMKNTIIAGGEKPE
ncbi:MAG: class I SAM-dependent methyltransferase [Spirochaetales bacterium]|nr:class I SAM-dependent methyltransferase [Spirochaetales bacterium]